MRKKLLLLMGLVMSVVAMAAPVTLQQAQQRAQQFMARRGTAHNMRLAKQQLRIDYSDEDTLLDEYGQAAEDTILNILNRDYYDVMSVYGKIPAPIVQATMLLVGQSYQHREPSSAQNMSVVPYSIDLLLKPYMRLTSGACIPQQFVTLGSYEKILISSELPDDLTMQDVDFRGAERRP